MKAVKANKQYTITETEKKSYLAQGFDIIEDDGTVEHSPQATVSYSEYEKLLNENLSLKSENERLKSNKSRKGEV